MSSVTEKVTEVTEKAAEAIKDTNVAQGVKESLVGAEIEAQPSQQITLSFSAHAIKNEEDGEPYMGQEQFVNAVAPPEEDYVSSTLS